MRDKLTRRDTSVVQKKKIVCVCVGGEIGDTSWTDHICLKINSLKTITLISSGV